MKIRFASFLLAACMTGLAGNAEENMKKYQMSVQFEDPFIEDLDLARRYIEGERPAAGRLPRLRVAIDGKTIYEGNLAAAGSPRTHVHFGFARQTVTSADRTFSLAVEGRGLEPAEMLLEFKDGTNLYLFHDILRRRFRVEQTRERWLYK